MSGRDRTGTRRRLALACAVAVCLAVGACTPTTPGECRAANDAGRAAWYGDRMWSARRHFRAAAECFEAQPSAANAGAAVSAWVDFASVSRMSGRRELVVLATNRILALGAQGRIPAQRQVVDDLSSLAIGLESGRDLARAEAVYRLSASLFDPARDGDRGSTSGALLGLGGVLLAQRRADEAAEVLERSLAIRQLDPGPLSYWLVPVLEELPRARRAQGQTDVADALTARAAVLNATEGKTAAQVVAEALGQIDWMPAKLGQPQTDPNVIRVLARGSEAVPALIEHLTSTEPSRFIDFFGYSRGDLAHRLLCELYRRPLTWPVSDVARPIGGHGRPTFMDYLAFVNAPHGRERLQDRWREVVRAVPLPTSAAAVEAGG